VKKGEKVQKRPYERSSPESGKRGTEERGKKGEKEILLPGKKKKRYVETWTGRGGKGGGGTPGKFEKTFVSCIVQKKRRAEDTGEKRGNEKFLTLKKKVPKYPGFPGQKKRDSAGVYGREGGIGGRAPSTHRKKKEKCGLPAQ